MRIQMAIENQYSGRMDCSQLAAALLLAADGELKYDELLGMERHLAGCPACRTQRALFLETDRRLAMCGEVLDSMMATTRRQNRLLWLRRLTRWQGGRQWIPALSLLTLLVTASIMIVPRPSQLGDSAN